MSRRSFPFFLLPLLALAACGDADDARHDADAAAAVAPADARATNVTPADTAPSEPPSAPSPRARAPEPLRGLYLNAYAAGSRRRLPQLLDLAQRTEINAFVIDVKDERGIRYRSEIPLANELAQEGEVMIRDLEALVDTLHAHDVWSIARIVVFKDPILSKARPEWSVRRPDGELWVDKAGNTWVSPWDEDVWDYNLRIAEEAARAGFDEIQFDYVRFAEPYPSLPDQVHPEAEPGGQREDAIAAFLAEARRRLHPLGAVVAADVFGLSPNTPDDVGIGQQWETIASTTDHILPMMYPSHYLPTHLPNVPDPDLMPYETLYKSAGMAALRNRRLAEAGVEPARVIPWLQAFTATWLAEHRDYGAEELREQKRGVYDVGLDDWVLWHPGSKYEHVAAGLDPEAAPRAREYTPPADVRATVDRYEGQGVAEARARAARAN